jgi:predicted MFS family arabinose efflux permease
MTQVVSPTPRTSSAEHHHRPHRAWWIAVIAAVAVITAGAFATVPGLLVDPLHQDLHWSRSSVSLAASVNMVLFGATAPFAAALMDRFGIRRIVTAALALVTLGAALTAVMNASWELTLYWGFLVGIGSGSLTMTFAATLTSRWFATRRGMVTGVLSGASQLGQLLFMPVVAWTIERYQWRPAVVTLALVAAVVSLMVWLLLRDHPADVGGRPYGATEFVPKPAPETGAALRTVRVLFRAARTGTFWLLAGMFVVCGASTNGIMWSNFVPAASDHHMPATVAASMLSLIGVFSTIGALASGWLTDRFDPRRLLTVYFGVRAVTLILLPGVLATTVGPSIIAFVIVYGLVDMATVPPVIALCRIRYREDGPIVFGWTNVAHQLGAGTSAFFGALARDASGSYTSVWLVLSAMCVFAALLAVLVRRVPVLR